MKKISVFNHVTVDGFFAGPHGEIDWFKVIKKDDEYEAYTHQQSRSDGALVFGRTTYEMMKSYWPTPDAVKNDPDMADVVNNSPKIVFSKTLKKVEEEGRWKNIELLHNIEPEEILRLKQERDITILGSGTIVQQFANFGLIDEYQLVVVPIILGTGKYLFKDVQKMNLKLREQRAFSNGIVVLRYQPAK